MKSNLIPAFVLIALGVLLLMDNLIPEFRITAVIFKWWPVILIVLGVNMLVRRTGSK
jgi:hypothetical protein